ncbi:hypothetical protein [Brevibacterium renqingii]|uniref:hypothetical protein n=1 Tax=Brevibacterium renqingii TaxID=2776916 RepID=UPI001ADFA1D1|nr:hypothetical protein [Brevibacterium renqingii]
MNQTVDFRPVPLPFTASEARRRGITAYALADRHRFSQIFRGIWVDTESLTDVPAPRWADHRWLETWVRMTGIRMLYPSLAADHLTAARLYGLPLPSHISDKSIHVATASRNLRISRPGLVVRRPATLRTEWVELLGLPLATIPRVIATLAPLLSLNELVTVGDAAIGRQASGPYITRERLREEIAALPRVAHRRKVRKALTLMRETVDSPQESWLRLWLIGCGFQEPVVHPAVYSPIDDCVLHPDLGYPELRIAIEYEGDQHRTSPAQYAQDIRRRELFEAEGWVLLRVAKRSDMASFAKRLRHCIAERSSSR